MTILWLQPLNLKLLKSMRKPLPIYEITLHLKLFVRWVALLENCWELNVKSSNNSVLFGSKNEEKLNCLSCFKMKKCHFFILGCSFKIWILMSENWKDWKYFVGILVAKTFLIFGDFGDKWYADWEKYGEKWLKNGFWRWGGGAR